MINFTSNGKVKIVLFMVGSIKKMSLYKMSSFPELYTRSESKLKV